MAALGCRIFSHRKEQNFGQARRNDRSYPESFPQDFGERIERLIELTGLSWEEFARRLGVELERVMAWREGEAPTGGEVWHIMHLAFSVPGGMHVMLPMDVENDGEGEKPI